MSHQLLIQAFEKAKKEIRTQADTPAAEHLSDFIQEDSGEPISSKSLRNYHKIARAGTALDVKNYVVEALCHYLGYAGYEDFLVAYTGEGTSTKNKSEFIVFLKRHKFFLIAGALVIIVLLTIHYANRTRWMLWQEDRYVETPFEDTLLQDGVLKLYKEDRIENLRKIKVDCNTQYKNTDGTARVWYGKNKAKQLEYFSSPGLHPETGKTLRGLSKYMFDKHICPKLK